MQLVVQLKNYGNDTSVPLGQCSCSLLQIKDSGKYKSLSLFPQLCWHQNKCFIVSLVSKMKLKEGCQFEIAV